MAFVELSVATAVIVWVPTVNVCVIVIPVPSIVVPSYQVMLAIPLASLAIAASVKDVSLVPDVGLDEIVIVGAVLSTAGGVVISSVIILDVA